MSITLSPQMEAAIRKKVEKGLYASTDEALETAVKLLDERDQQLQKLRSEVAVGLAQLEKGEMISYTPDMLDRLIREASERTHLGLPVRDVVKP